MITQRDRDLCASDSDLGRQYRAAFICYNMKRRYGLGDWIAVILSTIGITETLLPGCGCKQRRQWLNSLHA